MNTGVYQIICKGVGHLLHVVSSKKFRKQQSERMKLAQASGRYTEANRKGGLTRSKKYLIRGEMLTKQDIAKKYEIPLATLDHRAEHGDQGEDLIRTIQKEKIYKVRGEMLTITQIAKKYDLTRKTVSRRVERGQLEDDLIRPMNKRCSRD